MESDVLDYLNIDLSDISFSFNDSGLMLQHFLANASFMPPYDESQHTRDLVTYYLTGIGCVTLSTVGVVCNMMSLVVLTRRCMRSSTYSYLSALAVCDTLLLICTMLLVSKDLHRPVPGEQQWGWSEGWYPHAFPYVHALAFTFQVTSIWLTLSFTVDRYIMICHPFTAEPYCTISRARKVIVFIFLLSILFNIPKFFEYETIVLYIPWQNKTRVGCDLTPFGSNRNFKHLYHSGLYIAFVFGVPFLALAILNAFLMLAVHRSRKRGREIAAADRKRNDTTIMLISVVVVFFICQMPALVSRSIWAVDDQQATLRSVSLSVLNEIANFMVVLNSSINIVPYYFFGARFRREFWRVFCVCLLKYNKKVTRNFSITGAEGPLYPPAAAAAAGAREARRNSRKQSTNSNGPPPLVNNGGGLRKPLLTNGTSSPPLSKTDNPSPPLSNKENSHENHVISDFPPPPSYFSINAEETNTTTCSGHRDGVEGLRSRLLTEQENGCTRLNMLDLDSSRKIVM